MDDYAFLIKGLLDLYEASLDTSWLNWARELQKKQDDLFWDNTNGGYFNCSTDDSTVLLRLKEGEVYLTISGPILKTIGINPYRQCQIT